MKGDSDTAGAADAGGVTELEGWPRLVLQGVVMPGEIATLRVRLRA